MRNTVLGSFLAAEALLALFLSGCGATFDFAGLRQMEPEGDGFTAALSREYKEFALFEADRMNDWPDAAHFGTKAWAAAGGEAVPPEKPRDWNLPDDQKGAITAGWARLGEALGRGAGTRLPGVTAHAQARFDCWIEQQEENWQTDHIAQCRDGFHAAIEAIEAALPEDAQLGSLVPATPAAASVRPDPRPKSFAVFFGFDSTELGADGADAVNAMVEAARAGETVHLIVSGHADRAGPGPYNQGLSLRRATAVRDALIATGVAPERIAINALGETHPRVSTPDGVREPRNRRVEVTVAPASML
jgi:OmpA-OmpF porin, OOP family